LAAHWEETSTAFRDQLPRYPATYLVDPSIIDWIRWYRGSRLQEQPTDGGRVRVQLVFDAEYEAVRFALSLGGRGELLEPAHLRAQIAAAAAATAALHGSPATP
jgi:predicted DNA-binding transcriptional regulator YafY